jgi:hypothetical protein
LILACHHFDWASFETQPSRPTELSPIFHIMSEFVFSKSGLESKLMDMSNLMVVMGQRKLLIQLACV